MAKQIQLTQGKSATVDDDDYEWLTQWKWSAVHDGNNWYAVRNEGKQPFRRMLYMHVQIMGTPKGMDTDHIDHDGLNNQRANLRVCTSAQNQHNSRKPVHNSSGYKGVSRRRNGSWIAQITLHGVKTHIGLYATAEEAARAYDRVVREHFGECATVNFGEK